MFKFLNEGLLYYLTNEAKLFSEPWQYTLTSALSLLLVLVIAYLLGSVNSALIISKTLYRDDIRKHGSGNAGLTNMLRTFGGKAAALTLVGDILKTVLAIFFAGLVFGFRYNGIISTNDGYCYLAGLFAVIGHIFPVFYGFKGGKGVLATATMALMLSPIVFLILITIFIIIVAISKYVSLGSVSVAVLYPVVMQGYFAFMLKGQMHGLTALSTIMIAILIVWCHRENLKRISDRTEHKLSFKKKEKESKENDEGK